VATRQRSVKQKVQFFIIGKFLLQAIHYGPYSTWKEAEVDLEKKGWERIADNRWTNGDAVMCVERFRFMPRSALPVRA